MKRIFGLVFIVLIGFSYGNSLDEIVLLYKKKEYKQSYHKAKAYLKKEPASFRANLILGDSAYKIGRYNEALIAYDRILILVPNHVYTKIQQSKVYAHKGYKNISLLELNALLATPLTKKQRNRVLRLKKKYKSSQLKKRHKNKRAFRLLLGLGVLYDSNPSSEIGDKTFKIPALDMDYKGKDADGDFAHYQNLYFLHDLKLNKFGLLSKFSLYNKTYFKAKENDSAYLSFGLTPYYTFSGVKVYFPLVFNKSFTEHDSNFNSYGGGVYIQKPMQKVRLEAGYKYLKKEYYGKNKSKDSSYHTLYGKINYKLTKNLSMDGKIQYNKNIEKEDLRTDVNYDIYGLNIGLYQRVFSSLTMSGKFGYKNYRYKDTNRVFLDKRQDNLYSYGVGANYKITKRSSVSVDFYYLDKKSNQFLYEYDKYLVTLGYLYRF